MKIIPFEETAYCFPQWLHHLTSQPIVQKILISPQPHQHFFSHSNPCEEVPHCVFDLHFLQPTPVFLPEESHGQRSLAGYIHHGVAKSRHD